MYPFRCILKQGSGSGQTTNQMEYDDMDFSEIVAPTIKELFVRRMEDMILSGELLCGDQLPSERELAEQMKISKTAVHSGITDMVRKGFLTVVPRVGIFVADYAQTGTLETLSSIMQHNGGKLDERNAHSVLEIRYALESVALKHVIESRDPEVLSRLAALRDEAIAAPEQIKPPMLYSALAEIYFKFHHYICAASGNTIAPMIMNAFQPVALSFWANSARALGITESVGRLSRLYDYIEAGDLEKAISHLEWISTTSDEIVRDPAPQKGASD